MTAAPVVPVRGRLFRAQDAADYLGISIHRVRRLLLTGELIAVRTAAGRLEGIYETDCDLWIAQHRTIPTQAPARPSVDERVRALLPTVRQFA